MQPYFLPYIGYFQLMQYCDVFVIYDDIQYSKQGWINRNRMLLNGAPRTFTLPLQRDSDFLDIRDRRISPEFEPEKLMGLFNQAYAKAPGWDPSSDLVRSILAYPSRNLFDFVANSIANVASCLGIETKLVVSSDLNVKRSLRGQDRVLTTCEVLGAKEYINPIGGLSLYSDSVFRRSDVSLRFLRSNLTEYPQNGGTFLAGLSITDVVAWCGLPHSRRLLATDYQILTQSEAWGTEGFGGEDSR
jgi:hypothetical protein